mgnify:CR=1 FL=1
MIFWSDPDPFFKKGRIRSLHPLSITTLKSKTIFSFNIDLAEVTMNHQYLNYINFYIGWIGVNFMDRIRFFEGWIRFFSEVMIQSPGQGGGPNPFTKRLQQTNICSLSSRIFMIKPWNNLFSIQYLFYLYHYYHSVFICF